MSTPADLYAGLTNLKLLPQWGEYQLGEGLVLRPTFAHMTTSHMLAFEPTGLLRKHAAPWKATSMFESFEIHTELHIPVQYKPPKGLSHYDVARTITVMMRLRCDAKIRFLVMSPRTLSGIATAADDIEIIPVEASRQFLELELGASDLASSARAC